MINIRESKNPSFPKIFPENLFLHFTPFFIYVDFYRKFKHRSFICLRNKHSLFYIKFSKNILKSIGGFKIVYTLFRGLTPQIDLTKCPNTGGDTGEGSPIYEVGGYAISNKGGIMLITLIYPPYMMLL